MSDHWSELVERMSEQMTAAMEASTGANSEFVESWQEAVGSMGNPEYAAETVEGYGGAYEAWMDAAEETAEKVSAAAEGEEVSPEEFRDVWLDNANEAFKQVMSTDAFAAATGQNLEDLLEMRQRADENAQATLHEFGFATERDVRELGERLVELERRQQRVENELERLDAVEKKLDRVLEHLEGSA
jgi:hypothetical protein